MFMLFKKWDASYKKINEKQLVSILSEVIKIREKQILEFGYA